MNYNKSLFSKSAGGKTVSNSKPSKKRKYKQKSGTNKSTWAGAIASVAKPLIKYYLNPEYKVKEVDAGPQGIGNTAQFFLLNNLIQGTDYNQRVGRTIKMTKISIRGTTTINAASTANQYMRIMLVVSKFPNTTAPTSATLFGSAAGDVNCFLNLDYRKYYKILYDQRIFISPDYDSKMVDIELPLGQGIHTVYNGGNANTIADIMNNAVYLVAYSDQATNIPTLDWISRIRYLDN